ncbi:MAG TPA: cytochrome c biogenesis protein CcsA [Pseudomonas sp.]|jgi:ABC-type uncharacterized transport system permease subunit|uniref:cytochrome C assembly family protein n=1 Tax=Pseudomonas sp. TaxID=306 RepID=UPI002BC37A36|nr:cytochrome c biogenesis protein CcsA [Pseudomonas sp.]HTO18833.1 cytochrome c biogenesis protein CcsA [Pseudomonas sp.]
MHPLLPSLAAACLYAGATAYQGTRLGQRINPARTLLTLLGALALIAHVYTLADQLFSPAGLTLDFFRAASLISAAVIALILLASQRMPVQNLLLLLFPLGFFTVLLAAFAPSGTAATINEKAGILSHILLSILAYGLLTIAMFQSLLLLLQDHQLKQKRLSSLAVRSFPPLQTMESLLISFIWAGWLLLSLSLLSGWIFLDNLFSQHLAHKTFLSLVAWVVFGILLWGRHRLGWRGHTAVRWTLAGFLLLMLAYFGSKLVREFILHV